MEPLRIFAAGFGFPALFLMPVYSFHSELLTPSMAASSTLRMIAGAHGVSLRVENAGKTLALKSWQFTGTDPQFKTSDAEMRAVFGAEFLLEYAFAEKICALASPVSTLVPRRLFDPNHLDQYFKLLLRSTDALQFGFESLEEFDCYLVWAAEKPLMHLCGQYFPQQNIRHIGGGLLRAFCRLAPEEGYAVFAHLLGQKIQIAVFERQNLVFFNSYDYSKPSDLLYFVLLAYKQFDLSPLEIPLTLSGSLLEDSEIFRLLMRYIRPLRFPPLSANFTLPEDAKKLPNHFWFDLSTL